MIGKLFSPRTIGVCGSSRHLSPEATRFCGALGRRLAADTQARIISGGTKKRSSSDDDDLAADWLIVTAAATAMARDQVLERIATVVREDEPGSPARGTTGFRIGTERRARGKTSEARRISFVRGLDALIAVAGSRGTNQELALAIEHDIPVLPVPAFAGAAREFWDAYRPELIETLRIDADRADRWEHPSLGADSDFDDLADDMVSALFDSLPRRCFVIMPYHQDFDGLFDFVISPAVKAAGDVPVRLDRVGAPGDVKKQIDEGIRNCEYSIAVLDHLRANVLYELGFAHGCDKPTILLNRDGGLGADGVVPFDLSTQNRLEYSALDAALPLRLTQMIKALTTTRR